MAFRWSQGLSGYRLPFCQHNGWFVSPCAPWDVPVAVLARDPAWLKPAQSLKITWSSSQPPRSAWIS